MSLTAELQERVRVALKAGRKEEVSALRLLVSELQLAAKESRADLDEEAEIKLLRRERKRRLESADAFRAGRRDDLAARQDYEAALIEELLPQTLEEGELALIIEDIIRETGADSPKDMGRVMSIVMGRTGGRADGATASRLVKERLSRGT